MQSLSLSPQGNPAAKQQWWLSISGIFNGNLPGHFHTVGCSVTLRQEHQDHVGLAPSPPPFLPPDVVV